MILPAPKNFVVALGVGFSYPFQWNRGGVPIDLSLYNGRLILANYDNSLTYLTLTNGVATNRSGIFFGGNTSDPTNGIIDLTITGTDTSVFTFQNARYSLSMIPISNPESPLWLMTGTFSVIGALP